MRKFFKSLAIFASVQLLCVQVAHAAPDQNFVPEEDILFRKIEQVLQSMVRSHQPNLRFRSRTSVFYSIFFFSGFRTPPEGFLKLSKNDPRRSHLGKATEFLSATYHNYIDRVLIFQDKSDRELFRQSFAHDEPGLPGDPLGFYLGNFIASASRLTDPLTFRRQLLVVKVLLHGLTEAYGDFNDEKLAKQTLLLFHNLKQQPPPILSYLKLPAIRVEIEALVKKTLNLSLPEDVTVKIYADFLREIYPNAPLLKTLADAAKVENCDSIIRRWKRRPWQ